MSECMAFVQERRVRASVDRSRCACVSGRAESIADEIGFDDNGRTAVAGVKDGWLTLDARL